MIQIHLKVILISILFFSAYSVASAQVVWEDSYEASSIGELPKTGASVGSRYRTIGNPVKIDNRYSRNGKQSFRAYLNRDTSRNPFRTMTIPQGGKGVDIHRGLNLADKHEMWYGFSIYIPNNYKSDYSAGEIVAQWHSNTTKDGKPFWGTGAGSLKPNIALRLKSGNWWVVVNSGPSTKMKRKDWFTGLLPAVVPGQWNDFVFHMKWADNSSGLLEMWHNGTQYISHTGALTYAEEGKVPYFTMGIYKSSWRKNTTYNPGDADIRYRDYWFDEIRIALGKNGKRSDVDPAAYNPK